MENSPFSTLCFDIQFSIIVALGQPFNISSVSFPYLFFSFGYMCTINSLSYNPHWSYRRIYIVLKLFSPVFVNVLGSVLWNFCSPLPAFWQYLMILLSFLHLVVPLRNIFVAFTTCFHLVFSRSIFFWTLHFYSGSDWLRVYKIVQCPLSQVAPAVSFSYFMNIFDLLLCSWL